MPLYIVTLNQLGGEKMGEKQESRKGLNQLAIKTMASIARGIAQDSVDGRCFMLLHQPEKPKDLATRLQAMMSK